MYLLKGCPRCHGDMYLGRTRPEKGEAHCIQCGYREYSRSMTLAALLRFNWLTEGSEI